MKHMLMIVCAGALLLGSAAAVAEENEQFQDVTEFNFHDEIVEGDTIGPNGSLLQGSPQRALRSLIKVRCHFVSQLLLSVEDI